MADGQSLLGCNAAAWLPAGFISHLLVSADKNEEIPRVPIVCTGNDFSTLYAPLIRDGRMEKVLIEGLAGAGTARPGG